MHKKYAQGDNNPPPPLGVHGDGASAQVDVPGATVGYTFLYPRDSRA